MIEKVLKLKNVVYTIVLAVIVYAGFVLISDWQKLTKITVNPLAIITFLCLALTDYLIRGARWHYLAKKLGAKTSFSNNALTGIAGLSLTITPGKVGDVIKPYLLKKMGGPNMTKTIPAVVLERLVDMISLSLLALTGILINNKYATTSAVVITALLGAITLMSKKWFYNNISKLPLINKFAAQIKKMGEGSKTITNKKNVLTTIILTLPAWLLEGVGLYVLLNAAGVHASLLTSVFVLSFSIIVGAITMLPGGIGAAEASMTVLLTETLSINFTLAVWVTLVTRLCTLWFATIVGTIALIITEKRINTSEKAGPNPSA